MGFLGSFGGMGCGTAGAVEAPAARAAPPPEETKATTCLMRTVDDVVETLLFDADGNLVQTDRMRGERGSKTRYHRALTGELLAYEVGGDFSNASGTFVFGPHKELVAVRLLSSRAALFDVSATLRWEGTFGAAAGLTRPFVAHGGAGGATLAEDRLLAANLKVRQPGNAMPPMTFTGRVTVTYLSRRDRRETYNYREGRLESWEGVDGARGSLQWDDAENLVEERWCEGRDDLTGSPGRCYASKSSVEDGQIRSTTIRGGGSVTELWFDDKGRPVAGRSGASGSERSDRTTWSPCALPGAAPAGSVAPAAPPD